MRLLPRIALILALIVAGEFVFGLPFNVPRFFRPTMLKVFEFSNTQLGDMFAIYGITAMISYFPGGVLPQHFSARSLIAIALFATAAGGLYMATIPGALGMGILYGYWGVTTIFLLWGALILSTRDWGGDGSQGAAFGILEGGRGLAAAALASAAVTVLAMYFPENARMVTPEEREAGFRTVILLYSFITFLAGVLAWCVIPGGAQSHAPASSSLQGMTQVLRRPVVWAQALIILCAYCGYKGLDNYSLYAEQVLGMHEIQAERLATYGAWTRPLAALIAGLVADRFSASRSIVVMFTILTVSYASWAWTDPVGMGLTLVYINFFTTYIAVFALRGVYFALIEENRTPKFLTGAAVGLVSLVGFAPDAFFAPIAGRILDANPGIIGFQNYFLFLAAIAAVGILAISWLIFLRSRGRESLWASTTVVEK